jgi:MoxR-like ATPase
MVGLKNYLDVCNGSIRSVFLPVLGHRVKLSSKQRAAGKDVDTLLLQILNQIPIPKV